MKGLIVTRFEKISALEVKEIIGKNSKTESGAVIFDCSQEDLCRLCYSGKSFVRVAELLDSFEFKNLEEIKKNMNIKDFKAKSFAARCIKSNSEVQSLEVEKIVGEFFYEKFKTKVDLESPEKIVLAYVCGNKIYIGIDYAGTDLNKRDYKIFLHPAAIKADVAYSLLRIADYSSEETLLDPFCGSGTIAIEAALFAVNRSAHFYNKNKFAFLKFFDYKFTDAEKEVETKIFACDMLQHHLKSAEKNAKIAGINKKIKFSRMEVEWLDTKFEENSVDKIVTNPPAVTEQNKKQLEKTFSEFFHNAEFILKPKGKIVLITNNPEFLAEKAKKEKFKAEQSIDFESQKIVVFVFQ